MRDVLGAVEITPGMYLVPQHSENPWWWHFCPVLGRWEGSGTPDHTIVSRDPWHLEASLLASWCCGLHGFIRAGAWTGDPVTPPVIVPTDADRANP